MDDNQCPNETYENAQKSVNNISGTADKYKTKFGMNKTNHVIIGKDSRPNQNLTRKGQTIEKSKTYKHLGINHCNDGNMSLHINKVEAKVKTVTARIMQLTSDVTLKNVENVSTIKLIENTINSILLYGMEAIVLKKRDIDKLDSIQYNAIRNLFTLPWTTPKGIMRSESGIISLEMQIK